MAFAPDQVRRFRAIWRVAHLSAAAYAQNLLTAALFADVMRAVQSATAATCAKCGSVFAEHLAAADIAQNTAERELYRLHADASDAPSAEPVEFDEVQRRARAALHQLLKEDPDLLNMCTLHGAAYIVGTEPAIPHWTLTQRLQRQIALTAISRLPVAP